MLVLFDIDGTLLRPGKDWPRPHSTPSFEEAKKIMDPCRVCQDVVIDDMDVFFRDTVATGVDYAIMTGRADWSVPITRASIDFYIGTDVPMLVRRGDDLRNAAEIKADWIHLFFEEYDHIMLIDDDDSIPGKVKTPEGKRFTFVNARYLNDDGV